MLEFSFVAHQRQQGFAAGQSGVILNDVRRVDRQLEVPLQRLGKRQRFAVNGDGFSAFQPQQLHQFFHQLRVVLIPDAERIAGLIA
ncbi:hypothetical protein D3C87_1754500 [compost metagenome]